MIIPTLVDPAMAPPGQHTMSCFVQYAPYHLADGAQWDDAARDAFGETVLDTIEERAPNIRKLIVGKQVLTPLDIEQRIGLSEGNIFQGELSLEQLFFNRPVPGLGPLPDAASGLWMCGSAAHPGGGLMGAPGRIAALELLRRAPGRAVAAMSGYDVAVIGGGHNGLVAAGLLARGGPGVVVLERRERVGGVAELLPTAGRLRQSVIDSLRLRDPRARAGPPDVQDDRPA